MTKVDLDLTPILEIHRGEDAFVRFARKDQGQLIRVADIGVAHLQHMFPEFRQQLTRDSYFSLNSFWREGTARAADTRYLNVAFADCDYYRAGTDRAAALAAIVRAQDEGLIPPASILADSGRGLWAFYLLISEDDPKAPPRVKREAFYEISQRYRRIQLSLHKRLKALEPSLEPDRQAVDMSRLARIPGSVHSGSGERVQYWIQTGPAMKGFVYTLPELEGHFQIEAGEPVKAKQILDLDKRHRIPGRRAGYAALHIARLGDLETLWELRKGFREGHRNRAALVYAYHLRGYRDAEGDKLSEGEIRKRIEELAADCQPPLSPSEVEGAIASSRKSYRFNDAGLVESLEITGEELAQLSSINPHRPPRLKAGPKQPELRADRQAAILKLIESKFRGVPPPTRRMAEELGEIGIEVSYRTVVRDYQAMAIRAPQLQIEYQSPFLAAIREQGEALAELEGQLSELLPELPEDEIEGLAALSLAQVIEQELWRVPRRLIGGVGTEELLAEIPEALADPRQKGRIMALSYSAARSMAQAAHPELIQAEIIETRL